MKNSTAFFENWKMRKINFSSFKMSSHVIGTYQIFRWYIVYAGFRKIERTL